MTVSNAAPKDGVGYPNSVTMAFSSDALDLTIKEWWWTRGGDAKGDGKKLGDTHHDTGGTELSFLDRPATGDGSILVSINGESNTFTTTAGYSASATASAFDGFLSGLNDGGFSLINATLRSSTTVDFVGNLLGDPATELSVQVLHQDSTEPFTLSTLVAPEPSSWIVAASGIVGGFLYWLRARGRSVRPSMFT
jgi:hypothetical protein